MRSLVRSHAMRAQKTLSQGGQLNDILLNRVGLPFAQMAHLPNSAPQDFGFTNIPRRRQSGRFLFVGRNEVRKGLPLLLTAFSGLSHAKLDIVGETSPRIRPQPAVTFHGPIADRRELRSFFDAADYLVVPSFAEGMPTVILEAFSAALPVIATDVGAVAELVRNAESGFLVAPGDAHALAAALQVAARLPSETYRHMSARALHLASNDFSFPRVRQMLLAIVEDVLDGFPGAPSASKKKAQRLRTSAANGRFP